MMMLKRIRFVAFITTCSLLGILFLQGYWLYNTYLLASDKFRKDGEEVIKQLKNQHMLDDLNALGLCSDCLKKSNPEYLLLIANLFQTGTEIPIKLNKLDSIGSSKRQAASTIKKTITMTINTDLNNDMQTDSTLKKPMGKDASHMILYKSSTQYSIRQFKAMISSLRHEIDSLLSDKQIYSTYTFRLNNLEGKKNTVFSDYTKYTSHSKNALDAALGFDKPFQFSLVIGKTAYIFRRMQWVLLSSLVIIGITLWAFLFMLRTIFQQKRISDIKNDFINNMTHEFKTPLSTVSLAVEAVKGFESSKSHPQTIEYLEICDHELKRISGMVDKVLKAATFEQGEIHLAFVRWDLDHLIRNVVNNIRLQLDARQAQLFVEGLENMPEVEIDLDHLANVIYNLLDNALKYTEGQPIIKIRGFQKSINELELEVIDNGIGIPAAYLDKVFDNFFRVPTGNVHNAKGFGLGLSYSASIIKAHHGKLSVRSSPGKGSTFVISIPIKQP